VPNVVVLGSLGHGLEVPREHFWAVLVTTTSRTLLGCLGLKTLVPKALWEEAVLVTRQLENTFGLSRSRSASRMLLGCLGLGLHYQTTHLLTRLHLNARILIIMQLGQLQPTQVKCRLLLRCQRQPTADKNFSGPAFSSMDIWSLIFQLCICRPLITLDPPFSGPTFLVIPHCFYW